MYRFRRSLPAAVAALIVVAGLLVWLLVMRDDDGTSIEADGVPVEASEADLAALSQELGHPIYWLGEREDATLEVTRLSDDRVYVRYLDEGAEIGDPRPEFLTVGTYPVEDAHQMLTGAAEREGATSEQLEDGALVVQSEEAPTSVYLAYQERDLQIEVYDPQPLTALREATSGDIRPVD